MNVIPESPTEIIKDPDGIGIFGLRPEATLLRKDLERALITNLQAFLLEIGERFSFVARQNESYLNGYKSF